MQLLNMHPAGGSITSYRATKFALNLVRPYRRYSRLPYSRTKFSRILILTRLQKDTYSTREYVYHRVPTCTTHPSKF
eukprot:SAG31_NODE_1782_length_7281_cov_5.022139_2_plen_77_part_00